MGYVSHGRWESTQDGGEAQRRVDELAINPDYWLKDSVVDVMNTLVHEQCHIWQGVRGKPGRGHYHNKEWAEKMNNIGLCPSDTGRPGGKQTGDHMGDYIKLNGPFHQALLALINDGFNKLAWVETHPAPDPSWQSHTECPRIFDDEGQQYDLSGNPWNQDAARPEPAPTSSLPDRKTASEITAPHPIDETLLRGLPENPRHAAKSMGKSNRNKYQCKKCKATVWGKPELHVICGQCRKRFEEDIA